MQAVTTTNKGQSPMAMANWVSSHYWSSEQWSTDGEPGIADTTRASTLSSLGSACCRRGATLPSLSVARISP